MNRLHFGILEDKLMAEQTKRAIRCIEKRCKGISCNVVKVPKKDISALLRIINNGKLDAMAVDVRTLGKYAATETLDALGDNIQVVALIRNVDNRYVLMTRKKSGKHFANAMVVAPAGNISFQLQDMFDGVTCVQSEDTVREQIDRMFLEKCDGVLAAAAEVINSGCGRVPKVRYKYFDNNVIIPESGEGVIAVLCRKDLPNIDILKQADNKKITKELTIETEIRTQIYDVLGFNIEANQGTDDFEVSVRANINKDQLDINLYIYKDGKGKYMGSSDAYSNRAQLVSGIVKDVQKNIEKSNVF